MSSLGHLCSPVGSSSRAVRATRPGATRLLAGAPANSAAGARGTETRLSFRPRARARARWLAPLIAHHPRLSSVPRPRPRRAPISTQTRTSARFDLPLDPRTRRHHGRRPVPTPRGDGEDYKLCVQPSTVSLVPADTQLASLWTRDPAPQEALHEARPGQQRRD